MSKNSTAKPMFSMVSDSTDPNITGCVAKWEFLGSVVDMHFDTGQQALIMDTVVSAAYFAGLAAGQNRVRHAITAVLGTYD